MPNVLVRMRDPTEKIWYQSVLMASPCFRVTSTRVVSVLTLSLVTQELQCSYFFLSLMTVTPSTVQIWHYTNSIASLRTSLSRHHCNLSLGAYHKVPIDLGLGGGLPCVPVLPHHLQLASQNVVSKWQKIIVIRNAELSDMVSAETQIHVYTF